MQRARKLLLALLAVPLAVLAAEEVRLDRMPADVRPDDPVSLQRGARVFVNYCLNCHSAGFMRYNRLQDLGLTERQIREYLIFTDAKVGDLMRVAMASQDGREWFGVAPPDLSVIARSRSSGAGSGADWLYTYMRGFYRDPARPTGWNNTIFPNVAMPHVLYELQGEQVLRTEERVAPGGRKEITQRLVLEKPGTMSPRDYDRMAADLVNFLGYVGEPVRRTRIELGIYVLIFLGVLFVLAYMLKKEYWKDVH